MRGRVGSVADVQRSKPSDGEVRLLDGESDRTQRPRDLLSLVVDGQLGDPVEDLGGVAAEQRLVFREAGCQPIAEAPRCVETFAEDHFYDGAVLADSREAVTYGVQFGGVSDDHYHRMRGFLCYCAPPQSRPAHERVMDSVTARLIPAGATVDDVYWALPTSYTTGDRFDSGEAALEAGVVRKRSEIAGRPRSSILVERFSVDLRWKVSWPVSGDRLAGSDFVVDRRTYDALADAEEHLTRIRRFRGLAGERSGH